MFNFFTIILEENKNKEVFNIKMYNKCTLFFFLVWLLLTFLPLTNDFNESYPFLVFITSPALWIFYWYFCFKIFKKILKRPRTILTEKAIRSVLVAILTWLLIVSNNKLVFKGYKYLIQNAYVILGGSISLIYPVLDMFEYTYTAIDKFERS